MGDIMSGRKPEKAKVDPATSGKCDSVVPSPFSSVMMNHRCGCKPSFTSNGVGIMKVADIRPGSGIREKARPIHGWHTHETCPNETAREG